MANRFQLDLRCKKVVFKGMAAEADRTFLVKGGLGALPHEPGSRLFGQFVADGGHGCISVEDVEKVLPE